MLWVLNALFGPKDAALDKVVNERSYAIAVTNELGGHLVKFPPVGKLDHLPNPITRDCLHEGFGESGLMAHHEGLETREVTILPAIWKNPARFDLRRILAHLCLVPP